MVPASPSTPSHASAPPSAPAPRLSGIARDASGAPVAAATVAVAPFSSDGVDGVRVVETAADGTYAIDDLPPGDYAVTATSPRASAAYVLTKIAPAAATHLDLPLAGEGLDVKGRVLRASGDALAGAIVRALRISDMQGDVFVTRASADGTYAFRLPAGFAYKMLVTADAHEPARGRVDASTREVDFRLKPPPPPPPRDAIASWLRTEARPIATDEPSAPLDDLAPLGAMVGDAKVVGLGEAPHSASEIFRLKHRMLRYLVEKKGFDTFAMEVNWPEADRIDEYVTTGKGSPESLLTGLHFWTSDTHEVLEMIRWMRAYNADPRHAVKVHFRGFDMQYTTLSAQAVAAYFAAVDPAAAATFAPVLRAFEKGRADRAYASVPPAEQSAMRAALGEMVARLDAHARDYAHKTSEARWQTARRHARLLVQADQDSQNPMTRDHSMFENFQDMMKATRASKVVVWAHNSHVSFDDLPEGSIGRELRAAYGPAYFVVGFCFDRGSFRAWDWTDGHHDERGVRTFEVGPAPADTLEGALAESRVPMFLVDLRPAPAPVAEWLKADLSSRNFGSAFPGDKASFEKVAPAASYDALLYVEQIHPTHPTATGERPPTAR